MRRDECSWPLLAGVRGDLPRARGEHIHLDDDLLVSVGLGALRPNDRVDLLTATRRELERRVGMRIVRELPAGELDRFEQHVEAGRVDLARSVLARACPRRREIVEHEYRDVVDDLRSAAPLLVAAGS